MLSITECKEGGTDFIILGKRTSNTLNDQCYPYIKLLNLLKLLNYQKLQSDHSDQIEFKNKTVLRSP